jgi:hypothetical protein
MLVVVLEMDRAEIAGYPPLFTSVFIRLRPVRYLEVGLISPLPKILAIWLFDAICRNACA